MYFHVSFVLQVDESLTTSKIAIRFANGKRETVTVNPELHTIGDLKSYVSWYVPAWSLMDVW